jgi:hypothetical protein
MGIYFFVPITNFHVSSAVSVFYPPENESKNVKEVIENFQNAPFGQVLWQIGIFPSLQQVHKCKI